MDLESALELGLILTVILILGLAGFVIYSAMIAPHDQDISPTTATKQELKKKA